MRAIRLYVDQEITLQQELKLTEETLHYALNVLRVNKSSELSIFNGNGHEYACEIIFLDKKNLEVRITDRKFITTPANHNIDIYLGISKSSHMDYAIQKSVEAGVNNIHPVVTERSVTKLTSKSIANKNKHWKKIIISACEQCGRADIPNLHTIKKLTEINDLQKNEIGFLLNPIAKNNINEFAKDKFNHIKFVIGAEGGLCESEIISTKEKGFRIISLGPRILRTETAALTAVVCAQLIWGDLAGK